MSNKKLFWLGHRAQIWENKERQDRREVWERTMKKLVYEVEESKLYIAGIEAH